MRTYVTSRAYENCVYFRPWVTAPGGCVKAAAGVVAAGVEDEETPLVKSGVRLSRFKLGQRPDVTSDCRSKKKQIHLYSQYLVLKRASVATAKQYRGGKIRL